MCVVCGKQSGKTPDTKSSVTTLFHAMTLTNGETPETPNRIAKIMFSSAAH